MEVSRSSITSREHLVEISVEHSMVIDSGNALEDQAFREIRCGIRTSVLARLSLPIFKSMMPQTGNICRCLRAYLWMQNAMSDALQSPVQQNGLPF